MELKQLQTTDGQDIYEMLQKLPEDENGFTNIFFGLNFQEFKNKLVKEDNSSKGIGLKEGYVPQTIFWCYLEDKPIGMVKVRHYLTEALKKHGGHIGYALVPEARGKGYGTELLRLGIEKARGLGIREVLATCRANNIPSRKAIERNGGQLTEETTEDAIYWIK